MKKIFTVIESGKRFPIHREFVSIISNHNLIKRVSVNAFDELEERTLICGLEDGMRYHR